MPPRPSTRVVLVHGAAVTASCWDRLLPLLADLDVVAVQRPSSGDPALELAALRPVASGALVVGVSGGATLGLALAASGTPLTGALLHEPAVGALLPELLAPLAAAHAAGGVAAFGSLLYGPSWDPAMAPADPGAVGRDLAVFRAMEPAAPAEGQGPVVVSVGGNSPPVRHAAAAALGRHLGIGTTVLPGCRHFAQWDSPAVLAGAVRDLLADAARAP